MDDDDIAIAATCLQLHITSSHEHYAERKKDSVSVRICLQKRHQAINTVFIQPYCQIWQITMKRNFVTL